MECSLVRASFSAWLSCSKKILKKILELVKTLQKTLLPITTNALRNYMKTRKICFTNIKYQDWLLLLILNVLEIKSLLYKVCSL